MTNLANKPSLVEFSADAAPADIKAVVERDGGVILRGFFTRDQIDRFNSEIDSQMNRLNPGPPNPVEVAGYAGFHGANTKRLTNVVTHSPTFRNEFLQDPRMLAIADELLLPVADSYIMSAAQVIEIGPGNAAQPLHRDFENWPIFRQLGPSADNITINFLVALCDFTEEIGATRLIPGSNLWPDYEDRGKPEDTIPALLNAGDILFIDGKVAHGGGENKSPDTYRRALAWAFAVAWLCGEEANAFCIPMDIIRTLPPKLQQILGFRSYYNSSKGGGSLWQVDYEELATYLKLD
jgi:ectoine hydroxylase-related dioxygenase (phytanoyl-CoA dioxygenase family)